jgi:hypothetical protein
VSARLLSRGGKANVCNRQQPERALWVWSVVVVADRTFTAVADGVHRLLNGRVRHGRAAFAIHEFQRRVSARA